MVLEPVIAHLEVRQTLERQLAKAARASFGSENKERQSLLEEAQMFAESEAAIMRGPLEALRLCQVS